MRRPRPATIDAPGSTASADPRLRLARACIDAACHLSLDLDQIAAQAACSRHHVIRLFRRGLAQTPHQYLTQRRIERAKALLAAGELSVTEVCFAVGFRSVSSFRALFRRVAGTAPGASGSRRRSRRAPGVSCATSGRRRGTAS